MKKWPRWAKICICLVIIAVSLTWLQAAYGLLPSGTHEEAFRRLERKNLIGSAEILGVWNPENYNSKMVMVGESDYGYTVCNWPAPDVPDYATMDYFEKTGHTTVFIPYRSQIFYDKGMEIPLFVFTELAGADRAELELTYTRKEETAVCHLETKFRKDGCFLFSIREDFTHYTIFKDFVETLNSRIHLDGTLLVEVTVYDRAGNILGRQTADFSDD